MISIINKDFGTTSACAENTELRWTVAVSLRNYLRVRGEYPSSALGAIEQAELPPRARRIHTPISMLSRQIGTTSACAENTACFP